MFSTTDLSTTADANGQALPVRNTCNRNHAKQLRADSASVVRPEVSPLRTCTSEAVKRSWAAWTRKRFEAFFASHTVPTDARRSSAAIGQAAWPGQTDVVPIVPFIVPTLRVAPLRRVYELSH